MHPPGVRAAAAAAKSLQSCPTLCDPIDGNPPGFPVPGILQARTLEWVAISFSNAWKGKVKVKSLSHLWLLATAWTAAHQAPPSMGFSRQEYWRGVPLPSLKCEGQAEPKGAKRSEASGSILASPFVCFFLLPLSLTYVNWANQEGGLFYLRSSFRSSDLPWSYFLGLFPSLSFSHRHFGLLFPILIT